MSDTVDQEVDTDLLLAAFGLLDEDRVPDLAPESVLRGPRTASSTPPQQRPRQTVVRRAPAKQQWGGDLYRAELARHPLLTADDEQRLALAVEAGVLAQEKLRTTPCSATTEKDLLEVARVGTGAFNEFLVRNLRLVYFWAAKYQGRGLDLDDLVQEGTLGLIRATHKFDYATGYKFSTYATWWIRQSVTRALADQRRTVRLPVHVDEKILQVRRSWAGHPDGLSDAEVRRHVSEDLDLDPVVVHQLLLWDRRSWSLEERQKMFSSVKSIEWKTQVIDAEPISNSLMTFNRSRDELAWVAASGTTAHHLNLSTHARYQKTLAAEDRAWAPYQRRSGAKLDVRRGAWELLKNTLYFVPKPGDGHPLWSLPVGESLVDTTVDRDRSSWLGLSAYPNRLYHLFWIPGNRRDEALFEVIKWDDTSELVAWTSCGEGRSILIENKQVEQERSVFVHGLRENKKLRTLEWDSHAEIKGYWATAMVSRTCSEIFIATPTGIIRAAK